MYFAHILQFHCSLNRLAKLVLWRKLYCDYTNAKLKVFRTNPNSKKSDRTVQELEVLKTNKLNSKLSKIIYKFLVR